MVTISLLQGGPGLCCLSPVFYSFIANQPVDDPSPSDITDYTVRENLEKLSDIGHTFMDPPWMHCKNKSLANLT